MYGLGGTKSYKLAIHKLRNASNFHTSIKSVLLMAQCFGLMPIYGITQASVTRLRFKWFSLRTAYSVLVIVGLLFDTAAFTGEYVREGGFANIVSVLFFTLQSLGYILFIQLARRWLALSSEWQNVDIAMSKYGQQPNLQRRFKITTVVFMSLALVEHLLCVAKVVKVSQQCAVAKTEPVKAFFGLWSPQLFSHVSYTHWKAFLIEIPSVMGTFNWNFLDLLLVLVSAALAERFRQINRRVERTVVKHDHFWKEIREDYTRLWSMCDTLNNHMCHLVSLSFGGNLFFICWQMFNSFKPMTGLIQTVYFSFSFGYLVGRTLTVAMYCCWINDESKQVLTTLFNLATPCYGPEADRLLQQITAAPPALSGSNSFLVTRDLCLQVAGAIITFELILLQVGPSFLETDKASLPCLT